MSDKLFLDSNVCLYCFDSNEKRQSAALRLLSMRPLISTQVIHETAAVCLGKWKMNASEVRSYIELLISKCDVEVLPPSHTFDALDLLEKFSLSWWDALIVASALKAGCTLLYTEDMQDGLTVNGSLTIKNPFV
jgi:predicted nucleic acid-binding protein